MDFKTFLENFDAIAEAPGGIQKLRSLILDLAVRGKLVPQNPEDEPAEALIQRIKGHQGKLSFEPTDKNTRENQLPKGWILVPLGDVLVSDIGGGTPSKQNPQYWNGEISWASVKDVGKAKYLDKTIDSITELGLRESSSNLIHPGRLIVCVRMGLGKLSINSIPVAINQDLRALEPYPEISIDYLYNFFLNCDMQGSGMTVKGIKRTELLNLTLPLPPSIEQKRIVEKVDELMALCDRLQQSQEMRDNLRQKLRASAIDSLMNAETDEELKQSWAIVRDNWHTLSQKPEDVNDLRQGILQLAVRGTLVTQNLEDESINTLLNKVELEKKDLVKNKKLKERWNPVPVSPDAIPYKIPKNWKWVRILDGVERVTVGHVGSMQNEYIPEGIPFLRSQNVRENRFDSLGLKFISKEFHDKLAKSKLSPKDVVVVRSGNVGTTCVIPEYLEDANCSDLVIIKRPIAINSSFLSYYMNSAAKNHVRDGTVGIALTHFNTESVANLPIPLPPLAEQKRIVAKVDELMQMCDQLEESLRQSQQRAEALAASTISHLAF